MLSSDSIPIRNETLYMPQFQINNSNHGLPSILVTSEKKQAINQQIFLTPKMVKTYQIEKDSFVQFSSQIQERPDFLGISTKLLASAYAFCRRSKPEKVRKIVIHSKTRQIAQILDLVKASIRAKQLANGRGDIEGSSDYFIQLSKKFSEEFGLPLTVIKGEELVKNGFRLHHAVGRASINDPVFINLSYNGNKKNTKWLALVGKGVLFDAGGLNLKSSSGMIDIMFLDKHGACSCFAAFQGIVRQKLKINVTVSMGFAENFIGSNCYRPQDIIKSRKGLTVRITDTDSEGRLILADAMNWTQQTYQVSHMVEMSTLTYSCIKALGKFQAGVYGNDQSFSKQLIEIGKQIGEEGWILPLTEDHHDMLDCPEADCISDIVDGAPGGSLAAAFLEKFVEKGVKWIHLDSAGVCLDFPSKSGTGWGAKLLMHLAKHLSSE